MPRLLAVAMNGTRLWLDPQYLSGIDPVGVVNAAVKLRRRSTVVLYRSAIEDRVSPWQDDIPFGCHRKLGGDPQHLSGINLVYVAVPLYLAISLTEVSNFSAMFHRVSPGRTV